MNTGLLPVPINEQGEPQPWQVLFVDDEANILSSLRRLFRSSGYQIRVATSGAEGLMLLAEAPADLVVSDMRMPEMDGAQFLEQVRGRWPDTMRVLLTGYADMQSTIDAINRGQIFRYISKPWDDNDIQLVVRQALERKHLEQEKRRLEALTARQNEELQDLNASLELKVMERTVELRQAHEKLKASFLTSIKVFAGLIELRESSLAGHSNRVAGLARKIAVHMGLAHNEVQDVFVAGLLHDIGKIGLPDTLLNKPLTHMNATELGLLRKHPAKGEQALMALQDLHGAAALIRSHHERFDGQGYPDGLAGIAIPIGARILAVANDYDGLQIGIVAQRRLAADDALRMVAEGRGKRYDPQVVDAILAVLGAREQESSGEVAVTLAELKPGMTLARDLLTRDGVLLLAADYTLDDRLISQIRGFARTEGTALNLYIYQSQG